MNTVVFPISLVGERYAGAYIKADEVRARITELEKQLSRSEELLSVAQAKLAAYQGGVEVLFKVTGVLWNETLWFLPEISVPVDWKDKNVRVIVLPEERIVGSNKTMEVE